MSFCSVPQFQTPLFLNPLCTGCTSSQGQRYHHLTLFLHGSCTSYDCSSGERGRMAEEPSLHGPKGARGDPASWSALQKVRRAYPLLSISHSRQAWRCFCQAFGEAVEGSGFTPVSTPMNIVTDDRRSKAQPTWHLQQNPMLFHCFFLLESVMAVLLTTQHLRV